LQNSHDADFFPAAFLASNCSAKLNGRFKPATTRLRDCPERLLRRSFAHVEGVIDRH
jgi:hypothetical protein